MLPADLVKLSFHNLLLHKIRSLLTSLGIIFGVGSVIAMLSISEGAKEQSLKQIEAMGIDKVILFSKRPIMTAKNDSSKSSVIDYGLKKEDKQHILQMDNVSNVTDLRNSRKKVMKGTMRLDLKLVAGDLDFLEETRTKIVQGRALNRIDEEKQANVCVIGKNVKRQLFNLGEKNVIGKDITIERDALTIVGVAENASESNFEGLGSPNDMIIIPKSTASALWGDSLYVWEGRSPTIFKVDYDLLIVKVADIEYIDYTAKRIEAYLEKMHNQVKDWGMTVPLDLLRQREATQNVFTIVMSSIASISLLVGGIGIMNIMLANVYERRKEIGTRRALGAQKKDILIQFLLETMFLTISGGMIGVLTGLGLAQSIAYYVEWPVLYSAWSIILALVISAIVGVVFGTYPAWQAANQNPIQVLRSE